MICPIRKRKGNGLKTYLEEIRRGRPRQMMLDWMMEDGYGKLKEEARQQEEWRRRARETAIRGREPEEDAKPRTCKGDQICAGP